MINGRVICTILTPGTLPLCCPAAGLDLGISEVAFIHSFEYKVLDLSLKNVVPHKLRSIRLHVPFTSVLNAFETGN